MQKRIITGMMLTMLVLSMAMFAFSIGAVKAKKLVGDVDGDGDVDMDDVLAAINAFGSYPDHPRWNENADMNGDNRIDITDLAIIIQHFGETD